MAVRFNPTQGLNFLLCWFYLVRQQHIVALMVGQPIVSSRDMQYCTHSLETLAQWHVLLLFEVEFASCGCPKPSVMPPVFERLAKCTHEVMKVEDTCCAVAMHPPVVQKIYR